MNCSCIGFGSETSNVNSKDTLALRNADHLPHPHNSLSTSADYCQITLVGLLLFFFFFEGAGTVRKHIHTSF